MSNYEPTAFSAQIVARLRGLIAQFDINQADLAQLCDVSQSQFSKIIRGVRPMTIDQFAALCDALDVSYSELVAQASEYVGARELHASPLVFVEYGDRLNKPRELEFPEFDKWAQAAFGRLDIVWGRPSEQERDDEESEDDVSVDVPGRQQDYDVVANESIDEFPETNDTDYDHA